MASPALKSFGSLWAEACKTMWVEVGALRHLESSLRGQYAHIPKGAVLVDWVYAPECRGRIGDTSKDFLLDNMNRWISAAATSRVVLLAAGFEAYFEVFLDAYLQNRVKYYAAGALTTAGDKAKGEILKCRGPVARIEAMPLWTTTKIANIKPYLAVLSEVYALRNTIAHDAGVVDARTAGLISSVSVSEGEPLRITPDELVRVLAPPIVKVAQLLDARIDP